MITNVTDADIAKVEKEIECLGKPTADEELACRGLTIEEYGKIKYLSTYYDKDLGGKGGENALGPKEKELWPESEHSSVDTNFIELFFTSETFWEDIVSPEMYTKENYAKYLELMNTFD